MSTAPWQGLPAIGNHSWFGPFLGASTAPLSRSCPMGTLSSGDAQSASSLACLCGSRILFGPLACTYGSRDPRSELFWKTGDLLLCGVGYTIRTPTPEWSYVRRVLLIKGSRRP